MPRTTLFDSLFRTPLGRQRFIYWQTVPLPRLTSLLLAIFCLFGMFGFILDLFSSMGEKPFASVVIWTVFTGIMGVLYVLVLTRRPRLIVLTVLVHCVGSYLLQFVSHHIPLMMVHPSPTTGVRTAALAIFILSALTCIFFVVFAQGEGRHSMRIQTELSLAHGIQKVLVPPITERFPRFEVYRVSFPSDQVGGDVVDVVALKNGSVFAYVADIAGHGLSAGILMGMVKTSIRTQLLDCDSPVQIFNRLNEVLPQVKESNMYATCTAFRIGESSGGGDISLEYAIASQPAFLRYSSAARIIERLGDEQLPIGLLSMASNYQSQQISISAGDILLVATDGILESEDKNGEAFGFESLERILIADPESPLKVIVDSIRSELKKSFRQTDDQTILLIRSLT